MSNGQIPGEDVLATSGKVKFREAISSREGSMEVEVTEGSDVQKQGFMEVDGNGISEAQSKSYSECLQPDTNILKETNLDEFSFGPNDFIIVSDELGPKMNLSTRVQEHLRKRWNHSVVVKLLGRPVSYSVLQSKIESLWQPSVGYRIIDLGHDYFLIKLANQEEVKKAVLGGPWVIYGHCLTVQLWDHSFKASEASISKVAVWIRLPDMQIQYYHEKVLWEIGNLIGRTLKIDFNTREAHRGKFARIAVELDTSKPITPRIRLDDIWQNIEYEGIHQICFDCGMIGHLVETCPLKKATQGFPGSMEGTSSSRENSGTFFAEGNRASPKEGLEGQCFGPWLIAQKRGRRPFSKGTTVNQEEKTRVSTINSNGSRFGPLSVGLDEEMGGRIIRLVY